MKDTLSKILEKVNLKKKVLEPKLHLLRINSNDGKWSFGFEIAYTFSEAKEKSLEKIRKEYPKIEWEIRMTKPREYSLKEILEKFDEYSEEGDILKRLSE